MKFSRWLVPLLLVAIATLAADQQPPAHHSAEYRAMQQKIAYLKQNAAKAHPDPKPSEMTEAEVNAYFNEGGVKLPKGVSHVQLTSKGNVVDGHAQVDFEEIMQGKGKNNPLYGLFSGSHDIHAVAEAGGVNGTGTIKVQSVDLDGLQIPPFALEWFVQHYLTPKYPSVGITSTFKMPLRIDSAAVDTGRVRLIQH